MYSTAFQVKWSNTIIVVLLLILPAQSNAEFFSDVYGGRGFPRKHNIYVNHYEATYPFTLKHTAVKFDNPATIGGRVGYWFNRLSFLGVAVDASHFFGPDEKNQDSLTLICVQVEGRCYYQKVHLNKFNNKINVLGFDAMLRIPSFMSSQLNAVQLQPYLTVGPALYFISLKDTTNFIPAGQTCNSNSIGIKAGAGLKIFTTKSLGIFVEYRDAYFHATDHFNDEKVTDGNKQGKLNGKQNFNIQTIVAGFSVLF